MTANNAEGGAGGGGLIRLDHTVSREDGESRAVLIKINVNATAPIESVRVVTDVSNEKYECGQVLL